jgi:6-phosphogluconolactonase (cycloisomerase 2 family)
MKTKVLRWTTGLIGGALLAGAGPILSARGSGMVYTESNASTGNQVLVFHRAADGTLTPAQVVASGGMGTGAPLASQGAVALGGGGDWLFAVNAGSNSISSFRVRDGGLELADTAPSGGTTPVSLAVSGHLLYVLNQGGTGNIAGFRVGDHGDLEPIPGSSKPLSSAAASAEQVGFSPDQSTLVVSEKATQTLDTYQVKAHGLVTGPTAHASNGAGPYGFTFSGRDQLLVTEAAVNAVSSYDFDHGDLAVASPSVPSEGAAPCWIAATPDGRFAYATNAHIGSIAGFGVGRDGALTFLGLTTTASIPLLDVAATRDYLYALAEGTNQILEYRVGGDGGLTGIGQAGSIPASAAGLVAR